MGNTVTSDNWNEGNPYERYVGRWSRRVAPAFIAWLALPRGLRWLDVGCGTGALSAAVLRDAAPSRIDAVEPSEGFLATARQVLPPQIELHLGDAAKLPLPDAAFDVVVSGLVLNFIPELAAALAQMRRVAAPGATIAAYVWDYAEGMQMMRHFWDAAVALDEQAAARDEGTRFPLCRPAALRGAFEAAGLDAVEVAPIDVPTRFADFDDLWQPFLGGQGPAPAYVASLLPPAREALRDAVRSRLPLGADGAIELTARAWAVRGRHRGAAA